MRDDIKQIKLKGRIFLTCDLQAETGLHIGGSDTGIEIGGVDKTVIRDPLTNRPYVPGSSLKGKVRSLLEKYKGLDQNQPIGQGRIHSCEDEDEYRTCPVCRVFGVPGERDFATPTRLVVRDVQLTNESADRLMEAHTDLPYTEVKTEVSIDRVTSAANPRQMERVPAGSTFSPLEFVYSVYDGDDCDPRQDVDQLKHLIEGLQLLEDDYLGGLGSRGSGKVTLRNIKVAVRGEDYLAESESVTGERSAYVDLAALIADLTALQKRIRHALGT
jgi:CRISPR-associated protein Csm3